MIIFKEISILHLYNFVDFPNKILFLWNEGRKKLAEIELLANQFLLKSYRNKRHQNIGHQFAKACELQNMVLNNLNFILTPSQQEAISEIEKDQSANLQMLSW